MVLLRATEAEAAGAAMTVAGLRVAERALRQAGRTPAIRVVVADDGAVALPATAPRNVEVRRIDANPVALAALRSELAAPTELGIDVVRPRAGDFATGVRVVDEATRRTAEDAVFADLLRGDLGFIARHVNKRISFRITRAVLCRLPVTPNQVTLGAAAIGLAGCWLIAVGSYPAAVAGFVLVQLQSVLDGCDGELARVRFQQTAIGEWLDTVVDDLMNLAIVAALGIGLARRGFGWPALAAAGAAFGMYLFYNVVSYRELVRQGVGGELINIRWKVARGRDMKSMWSKSGGASVASFAAKLVLALGRRDTFVFAWMILAIVDLLPVALLWAVIAAFSCFVAAATQVLARDQPPPPV